ncbi:MAG: T9SS type A sorting domain-containing protein [Bacteroidia bacterium]
MFFFTASFAQQSIPYCDNFNGATLWTVTTLSGSAWQQGSPTYGTTNSSHTPPNCFDVELAAAYLDNTITYLNSPAINFSSAPNTKLSFWQNRNSEAEWDGTRMEYTTDSGITWTLLGTVADPNASNWYNKAIINSSGLPAWDSSSVGWIKSTYNLAFLNGNPSVMFRFVFTSDASIVWDGFSIDDFCISLPPNTDIGVDSVLTPQSPVIAGVSVPVQVRVHNYGLLAATNFNVYYKLDNGTAIGPTNYPGSLAPGSSVTVSCSNIIIPAGTHIFSAYSVITNDGDQFNDTTSIVINAFAQATLSYCNSFDTGNNDWINIPIPGSTNNWELGTPSYGVTSSPHSAPNCWDVNLNTACNIGGANLFSPIFDFSSAINCSMEFWQNYNTNLNTDGNTLLTSVNGAPYTVLGTVGDPNATNWYNTVTLPGSLYAGWSGYSAGWVKSTYNLSAFNSIGIVQFQFHYIGNSTIDGFSIDDFCIIQPQPIDAGVEQILEPGSAVTANTLQQVKVRVKNYGTQPFNSFTVAYQLDGGAVTGPVSFPLPLTPGSSADVIMPGVIIPTGAHTLCAYTTLVADGNHFNDTTCKSVTGASIVTLPYSDNFDGANPGWSASAINAATIWENGTPAFGTTNSAYSAPFCWDINLNTGYESQAIATLTSPYFDFTSAIDARLKFYTNYNTEINWDGVRCEYRAVDTVWHVLGNVGSPGSVNWYDLAAINSSGLPAWAGASGGWQQSEYDSLNMLSGAGDVQFRFVFTSDFSVNMDGFSIDNFEIEIPLSNSAGTQAINTQNILLSPAPQYYQTLLVNRGITPLNTVTVSLKVDNTTVIAETPTLTPPLNYNESRWYSFISPWNATAGAHTVCAYTNNPNGSADLNNYDDTTCYAYTVLDSASVFPYCNDFENTPAWPAFNPQTWAVDNLWAVGTPAKPVINNAHSGVKCWLTDLNTGYGANESSALISPVFHVQQGNCYRLSFWHEFNTEYLKDGGTVELTSDNGANWTVVGWAGDPTWFNTNYVAAFGNPPITSGWSGAQTWTLAQHDIYAPATGEYIFRFRFGSNSNNNGYDGWAIDDVCFEEIASPCTAGIADYTGNEFYISQNEPNPANETTTIHFNLASNKKATLRITDVLGSVVFEKEVIGTQLTLDLKNFKSGVYFYELQSGEKRLVRKMVVVE